MTINGGSTGQDLVARCPASWTTSYISPEGYLCQLTLHADKGIELLERAKHAIEYLIESGCKPYNFGTSPQPDQIEKQQTENSSANEFLQGWDPSWCPIHQCHMKRREKEGQIWYSHKANGRWCKGS